MTGNPKLTCNPWPAAIPTAHRWLRMFLITGIAAPCILLTVMFCPGLNLDLRVGHNEIQRRTTEDFSYFCLEISGFHLVKCEGVDTGCSRPPPGWNFRQRRLTYRNGDHEFSTGWRAY